MSSSLFHILNVGRESLANARVGVDVTGHNISNAHTPGFSRQRVELTTQNPVQYGMNVLGNGARVNSIQRVHDKYLEGYLRKEIQANGQSEALTKNLDRLEQLFNPELTATVRQRMTTFQNALRELSNYPEEPAVRTNLVEAGNSLAQSFNVTHASITGIQRDISVEMNEEMLTLNQNLASVASLNQSIKELSAGGGPANDLLDKRDALIKEIGATIQTQVYNDKNNNLIMRGPNGALMVEGGRAGQFFSDDPSGIKTDSRILFKADPHAPTQDLTDNIDTGRMAGMLKVRNLHAQETREAINEMARGFAQTFNSLHSGGYGIGDFAKSSGRNFFAGAEEAEAASSLRVADIVLSDPSSISAAMSPETPGDNIIANEFIRVMENPIFDQGRVNTSDFYDRLVSKVGIDSMRAQEENNASRVILSQLQGQREAVAGVSLDEEAADLLKYQHLFAASSRVITTVDEMFDTVLGLKR